MAVHWTKSDEKPRYWIYLFAYHYRPLCFGIANIFHFTNIPCLTSGEYFKWKEKLMQIRVWWWFMYPLISSSNWCTNQKCLMSPFHNFKVQRPAALCKRQPPARTLTRQPRTRHTRTARARTAIAIARTALHYVAIFTSLLPPKYPATAVPCSVISAHCNWAECQTVW